MSGHITGHAPNIVRRMPELPTDVPYVVTGVTGTIGGGIAQELLAQQASVIGTYRTPDAFDALQSSLAEQYPNPDMQGVSLDLASPESVEAAAERIQAAARQSGASALNLLLVAGGVPDSGRTTFGNLAFMQAMGELSAAPGGVPLQAVTVVSSSGEKFAAKDPRPTLLATPPTGNGPLAAMRGLSQYNTGKLVLHAGAHVAAADLAARPESRGVPVSAAMPDVVDGGFFADLTTAQRVIIDTFTTVQGSRKTTNVRPSANAVLLASQQPNGTVVRLVDRHPPTYVVEGPGRRVQDFLAHPELGGWVLGHVAAFRSGSSS